MASSVQAPSKSVSSKSLEGLLRCGVCFEQFDLNIRSPRQLQCHHTFCLPCLINIAEKCENGGRRQNFLTCPVCREGHNFGQKGVQEIPTDHKIVQLMDALHVADEESDLCHQHRQQPLNFFCKTCEEPVCVHCTVVSHNQTKGHEVIEISEALKEFTPQFINTRDGAKKISEKLRARSSNCNKAIEQLTKNEASGESNIRKAFAGYRTQMEEKEKALFSQLRGNISREKDEIEVLRDVADHEISSFTKLDEQFQEAQKQQDIKKLFNLMYQMKAWEKSSTKVASDEDDRSWYEFKPQNENAFRKELFQLGNIDKQSGLLQQVFDIAAAGSDNASPKKAISSIRAYRPMPSSFRSLLRSRNSDQS